MKTLKKLSISNVLGIEELEIETGKTTVLTGSNGTGKTSVIESLKAAIGGGHDATLVRKGAEEGEVVLLLDDGTEIEKRIPAEGRSSVSVRIPDAGKISAPQSWLARLVDGLSFNPVEFLRARSEDRARYLLEAVPLSVSKEDLSAILGTFDLGPIDLESHAFEVLDEVRRRFYDERTGANRIVSEKEKTAASLRETISDGEVESPGDVRTRLAEARADLEDRTKRAERIVGEARDRLRRRRNEVDENLREAVRELEAEANAEKDEIAEEESARLAEKKKEIDEDVDGLRVLVGVLEERATTAERERATRDLYERTVEAAKEASAESEELSARIAATDLLRERLASDVPIDGLEVRGLEVFVDGVPFARANTARQVEVALEVAKLRAGDLPLVCVDQLESLDSETFEALLVGLDESGLQAIVTRVSDGPLEVATR